MSANSKVSFPAFTLSAPAAAARLVLAAAARLVLAAAARLVLAAAVLLAPTLLVAQDQTPPPPGCDDEPEARQLDFWIGTWDVVHPESGDTLGVNVIEPILHGCGLLENWTGARGGTGKSLNFWDSQRRTWRQVWVSDRGNVLDYRHGEFRDGAMHFRGITIRDGDTTHQKLRFESVSPDTVRQVFEASGDGESWETTWVGIYLRRPG